MALQTRGFQLSPPPLVSVPQNIGKVDVGAMYDRVVQGLRTQNDFQQNPQRLATEQDVLKGQQAQAQQVQALTPKETEVKGAGLDNDLIFEQRRRDKERLFASMSPAQQIVYEKNGFPLANTTATNRLPDNTVVTTKRSVAQVGGEDVPVSSESSTGPYALMPGVPSDLRAFLAGTANMTPEQRDAALLVKYGLQAKPSGAAITYHEVVGADGVTRLVAVDPRQVGAHVVGSGETYGSGVSPVAKPAATASGAPAASAFASPTIADAESQKATAQAQAKLQAEKQTALPKSQKAIEDWDSHSKDIATTLSDVSTALKELTPLSSGISRKLASRVPGTLEYNVIKALETVKANIGFDRLAAMRTASPTGGALGNVSDKDLSALQESIANLDLGQDLPIVLNNIEKVQNRYNELSDSLHSSFASEYKDFLPKQASAATATPVSAQDQQAITWAKANPSDPRAIEIMKLHPGL